MLFRISDVSNIVSRQLSIQFSVITKNSLHSAALTVTHASNNLGENWKWFIYQRNYESNIMVSGRIFFHYPANPVSGRIVEITIRCTPMNVRPVLSSEKRFLSHRRRSNPQPSDDRRERLSEGCGFDPCLELRNRFSEDRELNERSSSISKLSFSYQQHYHH